MGFYSFTEEKNSFLNPGVMSFLRFTNLSVCTQITVKSNHGYVYRHCKSHQIATLFRSSILKPISAPECFRLDLGLFFVRNVVVFLNLCGDPPFTPNFYLQRLCCETATRYCNAHSRAVSFHSCTSTARAVSRPRSATPRRCTPDPRQVTMHCCSRLESRRTDRPKQEKKCTKHQVHLKIRHNLQVFVRK